MGLRLRIRRAQAEAGDVVLLYGDESEALTHPYLPSTGFPALLRRTGAQACFAHAWAPRSADLRVAAPGQSRKVAIMGVFDAAARELIVHTSTTKRSTDFIALLTVLDGRYGLQPGRAAKPVVLVLDNGPIHTSKATTAAIAARPWLTVEWLPRYAPELNDIEPKWRDLKRHHLAHRTFVDVAHLDHAIHEAVDRLNAERQTSHPCDKLRIDA